MRLPRGGEGNSEVRERWHNTRKVAQAMKTVDALIFVIVLGVTTLTVLLLCLLLWPRNGRWSLNLASVRCLKCGTEHARSHKLVNWNQAMWGRYICSACDQEIDKYGNALMREYVFSARVERASLESGWEPFALWSRLCRERDC
jgi:hypothetical protein